uniref:tRNA (34-2'-O)-methyltransferase regulator WDR6 n=1 Tax=Lygus hesperus TaxID=30085 RepID=A0A146L868_LYGHE
MEATTLSSWNVAATVDGRVLGQGNLKINVQEVSWTSLASTEKVYKVDYASILKYGIFSTTSVVDWQRGLTLICNSEGNSPDKREFFFLLDDSLTSVLLILFELVDLDPTISLETLPNRSQDSKEDARICTSMLKTHVTCLKFIGQFLFSGIGDTLHIFSRNESGSDWACLISYKICQGQNIYGIEANGKYLVIYGGKSICFLWCRIDQGKPRIRLIYSFTVQDWVLDCIWLSSETSIAVLTANNAVISYDLLLNKITQHSISYCSERCILYSGKLLGNNWNDITVLAGTVFSTIMIWSNDWDSSSVNVIHELEGHKGVIFSITFCELTHRISSTSDDRTVRVWDVEFDDPSTLDWKNCSISLKFSLYGHSARVWKSNFLFNGKVVSVGEDSRICLWNNDGILDNQWSGHQNGEIWSLAVTETYELIATGGSDGGISLWPVARAPLPRILTFDSSLAESTPRCVGLTEDGSPFMVNNKGDILIHTMGSWQLVMNDSRFSSYCLHSVSPSRTLVAFGSISGCLLICRIALSSISKLLDINVCNGRIFSMVWLSDHKLAICEANGVFSIWNLSVTPCALERVLTFILPYSKERWITSCTANDQYVICGDRFGSLFLYSKQGDENPIFCAKRIHGHNGVTDLKLIDGKVLSTGRDGKYREFVIEDEKLILLRCWKLKLDWTAAIIETKLLQRVLICFHEVFFVIWSIQERRPILKIDCGGGHRSWDCLIDSVNNSIHMTYIKGKSVFYCCVPAKDVVSHTVVHGGHPKAINAAALVPLVQKGSFDSQAHHNQLVLLGGEDTTLRLVSVGNNCETQLSVLQSHLSSIRTVVCLRSKFQDTVYVASGGGRGQLIVWKFFQSVKNSLLEIIELSSHCVIESSNKNQEVPHDVAEMRIMDLELHQNSSEILAIAAACSDGVLRLFNYEISTNIISHLEDVDRGHCLLKIIHVEWDFPFLVSACTSGLLVLHRTSSNGITKQSELENSYSVSDSGINSCDYKLATDHLVVSCAGDDAHVNIIVFALNSEKLNMRYHWKNETAHTCQISGLKMAENWLFTTGLDRTLAIFSWTLADGEFEASLLSKYHLCIPDVHGTVVWRQDCDDRIAVYVHGLGTQLLRFSCNL